MKNYKDLDLWLEIDDLLNKGKDVYVIDKALQIVLKLNEYSVTNFYKIKDYKNDDNRYSYFTVESEEDNAN